MSKQCCTGVPVSAVSVRKPEWLRRAVPQGGSKGAVIGELGRNRLHTVCDEACCPNRAECFSRGTATFLILGEICSRGCRFCSVTQGVCSAPDNDEPRRVAEASRRMGLRHVVITSVTRDDLPDGGAEHFAKTVQAVRAACPGETTVEILIPDFGGNGVLLKTALDSGPNVLNHNVETVPRLYPTVRPQADFRRSLQVLRSAFEDGRCAVKSGIMVGLGEQEHEVLSTMYAIRATGCGILTIGQYLQPSPKQLPVRAYIEPAQFERYRESGLAMGFSQVASGPFVRSSYRAEETFHAL